MSLNCQIDKLGERTHKENAHDVRRNSFLKEKKSCVMIFYYTIF